MESVVEGDLLLPLGVIIYFATIGFAIYYGHKSAEDTLAHKQGKGVDVGSITQDLLNFSGTCWLIFSGDRCIKASQNVGAVLKSGAEISTLAAFVDIWRQDFQEPLKFFIKSLKEEGIPFYFKAKNNQDIPFDIKGVVSAQSVRPPADGTSSSDPSVMPGDMLVMVRYIPINQENVALKQSQINFELCTRIMDHIPFPCWIKRRDGRLVHANPALESLSAQKLTRLLKEDIDIISTTKAVKTQMQQARSAERTCQAKGAVVAGGKRHVMALHEFPLKIEFPYHERLTMGVAQDISREENLAKDLRKHSTGFENLLESLSIGVAFFDKSTRLTFYNRVYVRYADYGEGDGWLKAQPTLSELLDTLHRNSKIPYKKDFQAFKKYRLEHFKTLEGPAEELLYFPNGVVGRLTIVPHHAGGLFYLLEDITLKQTGQSSPGATLYAAG